MQNIKKEIVDFLPRFALTLAVTGHRTIPQEQYGRIKAQILEVMAEIANATNEITEEGRKGGIFDDVPNLRLATCLSEGSDRLAAYCALECGFKIESFLPFPDTSSIHAMDLTDEDKSNSRKELKSLCAKAESVIAFNPEYPVGWEEIRPNFSPLGEDEFAHNYRQQAYLDAGITMLEASDILLAIWRGSPQALMGSTYDIICRALARGLPVVVIDIEKNVPIKIVRNIDQLFVSTSMADTDISALIKGVWGINDNLLGKLIAEKKNLLKYQTSKLPRIARIWNTFQNIVTKSKIKDTDPGPYREETRADFKLFDNAANHCAARYRSSFLTLAIMSLLAVLFAAIASVFPRNEYYHIALIILAIMEGTMLIGAIVNVNHAKKENWQNNLTKYRYAAEVLRCNNITASLGLPSRYKSLDYQSFYGNNFDENILDYILRNHVRNYGMKSINFSDSKVEDLLADNQKYLIYSQICYHNRNYIKCSHMVNFVDKIGKNIFVISLLTVFSRFFFSIFMEISLFDPVISFVGTLGPAMATSTQSISQYADLNRLAIRSKHIHNELLVHNNNFNNTREYSLKTKLIAKAINLMLKDVKDWKDQYNLPSISSC